MIGELYNELIYRPLLNLLVVLYNTVAIGDLGVAIILLTILVRLALYPLFQKSLHHTMKMQAIQPKLKKIQEDHKDNKEKQAEAALALFKEHGTNPLSFFFFTFAQFPILIALYQLFAHGLGAEYARELYAFVSPPQELGNTFFGLLNLGEPNTIVVGLMALAQYAQSYAALPHPANPRALTSQEKNARRTVIIGPLVLAALFFFWKIPSAVGLYLMVSTIFSAGQQALMKRNQAVHGLERIS